jgi:phage terminase large subunit
MSAETVDIRLPPKLVEAFAPPAGSVQYRCAHGGRGSGKSRGFAIMAALRGWQRPMRILCLREFQSSIKDSFFAELQAAIEMYPWLRAQYDIGENYLRGRNGTEFLFKGLRRNARSIKSTAGVDLTIVEEAEYVPEHSWLDLEATVFREPGSELWAVWNPELEHSPVDERFRRHPPKHASIVELNYYDNPFFPANLETLRQREEQRTDPDTYAHVWLGDYLRNSSSQVLHDKVRVAEFSPGDDWHGPYYGVDWGFAQDPTAAVRCWVHDGALYVEHEAGRVELEIDDTAPFLIDKVPDIEKHALRGDSARPELISHLKRKGLPRIEAVKKWPGSVEDGITHLRSYSEIVVHPRCVETIRESRLWRYKVDKLTGDVLPVVVDAFNHYWDAVRYALAPLIRKRSTSVVGVKVAGL